MGDPKAGDQKRVDVAASVDSSVIKTAEELFSDNIRHFTERENKKDESIPEVVSMRKAEWGNARVDWAHIKNAEPGSKKPTDRKFPETMALLLNSMGTYKGMSKKESSDSGKAKFLFKRFAEKLFPENESLRTFKTFDALSRSLGDNFSETRDALKEIANRGDDLHDKLLNGKPVLNEVVSRVSTALGRDSLGWKLEDGSFNLKHEDYTKVTEIMSLIDRLQLMQTEAYLKIADEQKKVQAEELAETREEQIRIDAGAVEEIQESIDGIDEETEYPDYVQLSYGKFKGRAKLNSSGRELISGTGERVVDDAVEKGGFEMGELHGDNCEVLVDGKLYEKGRFEHGVLEEGEVFDYEINGKKYTGEVKMSDKEGLLPHGEGVWKTGLFSSQKGRFEEGVLVEKR